jgi:hypothetical protein
MHYIKKICLAAVTIGLAGPNLAQASFILDTGTPAGSGAPVVLNTTQSFASEFTLSANETISDLAAYVTAGADQPGALFEFSIYSNAAGFVGLRNLPAPLFTTAATFTANGWNSEAVNWTAPAAGNYWLVVGAAGSATNPGLDLPQEASATTGTAPALAFAYASGTNAKYSTSGAPAIGVEITGLSPTPLPNSLLFLTSGLLALGWFASRRSQTP